MASKTQLEEVEDKVFGENDVVILDGKRFVRCVFNGCHFVYGGGELAQHHCTISGKCDFDFVDAAHRTISLLEFFGYKMMSVEGDSPEHKYAN